MNKYLYLLIINDFRWGVVVEKLFAQKSRLSNLEASAVHSKHRPASQQGRF